jgi:hypothetical protein
MFVSSGLDSSALTSRGSSAIPQIGHWPGPSSEIWGCIGHVQSAFFPEATGVAGSSAMPHFGQLPGNFWLTSGCIGQM